MPRLRWRATARSGELAIMFGGPAATLARVRGALEAMGRSIMPTGDVGSAHAMKALNNLVSAGGFLIGVEAMLIGQQFGLDPDVIVDVLNASTGMNNSTQKKFKQFVLSRKFDSGFGLDLMVKDLGIALDIGANTGTPTPFASLCRDLWASAAKVLGNGQDHTAVARLSERLAGAELSRRRATENMQQAIGTRPVGFAAADRAARTSGDAARPTRPYAALAPLASFVPLDESAWLALRLALRGEQFRHQALRLRRHRGQRVVADQLALRVGLDAGGQDTGFRAAGLAQVPRRS